MGLNRRLGGSGELDEVDRELDGNWVLRRRRGNSVRSEWKGVINLYSCASDSFWSLPSVRMHSESKLGLCVCYSTSSFHKRYDMLNSQ